MSLPVCFQMLGENAPSQLILYHYPDLKTEKDVVLMTAEMDPKIIVSLAVLTFVAHFLDLLLTCSWRPRVYGPLSHFLYLHIFPSSNCLSLLLPTDCPPGSMLGQSGATVLRDTEAGDIPIG